jgi:hypothetical protein
MFQKKNVMLPAFHRFRLGLELVLDFNRGVWGGAVALPVPAAVTHSSLSTPL